MPTAGTQARSSAGRFVPMRRTRENLAEEIDKSVPEEEEVARLLGDEEEPEEVEDEEENGAHVTKSGVPDRRFKGQRDLPPAQFQHTYRQPQQGGVQGGIHVTLEGKPDRRFKENRNLDEEEVMRKYAENLADQFGIRH